MYTKFRPIVPEKARKSGSTDIDPVKLVKPIAISAVTKDGNEISPSPLHTIESQSDPPLKSNPDGNVLNQRYSEVSNPLQFESFNAQRFTSRKRSTRTANADREDDITLKDDTAAIDLEMSSHVGNIERVRKEEQSTPESRPENGISRKLLDTSSLIAEHVVQATNVNSNNSIPHKPEDKSMPSDGFIPPQTFDETRAGHAKAARDSDPQTHYLGSNAGGKISPVTNEKLESDSRKSPSTATNLRLTKPAKTPSDGLHLFSDILESEDSSKSDTHGSFGRKEGIQLSAPSLSSQSPSQRESDDQSEACSSPKMRKTSSGNRVSLRRMERKQSSQASSEEGNENPWFHSKSPNDEKDVDEGPKAIDDETLKSERGKKKKISRFSRLFRSAKLAESTLPENSTDSSSEELVLRRSMSDSSSAPNEEMSPNKEAAEEHLEGILSLAITGKRSLEEVVDALLGVCGRPHDSIMKLLIKYMGSAIVIDEAFKIILEHEHAKQTGIPMKSMAPSHARYSPRRETLINLFANGPEPLQKALLYHNKAKSEILRFFTEERPAGYEEIPYWASTATNLSKILNGLLRQFPSEISEYIGGKKGVLHLMIKNHVHVPEVVDFVVQLSAANALSETTGDDLRYGAVNATGLVLLAKEGICDLLVDIFKRSSAATAHGTAHLLEWQTQVMSTQCLLELSKRAVVIPRFTKENCSYSSRYIKVLNSSLNELSLFSNDARILSLLHAGFEAVSDGPEIEHVPEQSKRNNPLVCALIVIVDLLDTVCKAAGSKLAVTRRTVGSTDTANVEKHLVSKMARLCRLLHRKSAHEVSSRAKVAIVNVFRCLCSSKIESTRLSMVKSQIPDRLMILIHENPTSSVLHSCVLKCLSASLGSAHCTELHKEWLHALARNNGWLQVMFEYFQQVNGGDAHRSSSLFSTFVEIGFRLIGFSQDNREMKLRPMLKSKTELQTFANSVEAGLFEIRKDYETPCGGPKPTERAVSVLANAESLAARLHDFNAV